MFSITTQIFMYIHIHSIRTLLTKIHSEIIYLFIPVSFTMYLMFIIVMPRSCRRLVHIHITVYNDCMSHIFIVQTCSNLWLKNVLSLTHLMQYSFMCAGVFRECQRERNMPGFNTITCWHYDKYFH
jgi:hypothetical protein